MQAGDKVQANRLTTCEVSAHLLAEFSPRNLPRDRRTTVSDWKSPESAMAPQETSLPSLPAAPAPDAAAPGRMGESDKPLGQAEERVKVKTTKYWEGLVLSPLLLRDADPGLQTPVSTVSPVTKGRHSVFRSGSGS